MTASDYNPVADLEMDKLVALVVSGRTDLYEEIVRRYQRDVLQVVSAVLYDRSATEDLVQQVFVNAYVHLAEFQPGRDFGGWIRTIARNAARQELRRRSRYDRRLKTYGEMLDVRLRDVESSSLHEQLLQEALQNCLKRLPEKAAHIIQLRYHEDQDFNEIAEHLGSSSGAIRNLLCRVRVNLRECVEREMPKS